MVTAILIALAFPVEIRRFCVEIRKVTLRRNTGKLRRNTVGIVRGNGEVWGVYKCFVNLTVTCNP
jgi:hypothetical protein